MPSARSSPPARARSTPGRRRCRAGRGDRLGGSANPARPRPPRCAPRRRRESVSAAVSAPFAQARHQCARPQRVAAEVAEEVVVHRHWRAVAAGPIASPRRRRLRRRVRGVDVAARAPATGQVVETRQRRPIELAADRRRQRVERRRCCAGTMYAGRCRAQLLSEQPRDSTALPRPRPVRRRPPSRWPSPSPWTAAAACATPRHDASRASTASSSMR